MKPAEARFRDHGHLVKNNIDLSSSLARSDLVDPSRLPGGGADIIETNTFDCTAIAQADFGPRPSSTR